MAKKIVGKTDEVLEAETKEEVQAKETQTTKKTTTKRTTAGNTKASTKDDVKDNSTTIDDELENIVSEIPEGEVVEETPVVKTDNNEITEKMILETLKSKTDNNDITDEFIQKVCNVLKITRIKKDAKKKYTSVFWGNGQFMGMKTDD